MAQMVAMRKNLDERARRKAFDAIFKRFDYNHNGKNDETNKINIKKLNLGKLFIKDFVDELEMQEILLDEEEIEKISAFADAEGQVLYFCTFFCSYDFKN
jgi:hypothetical protein